jgi:hypothetical protein
MLYLSENINCHFLKLSVNQANQRCVKAQEFFTWVAN